VRADRRTVCDMFALNLREARKGAGLTQHELAYRLDMHQTAISHLECGWRCPRLDTALTLSRALGVQVADLLDGIK
jgi:DNA-binding XRE family transcriptional regulator